MVLAGASAEEVLKLEIVRDVDPDLGAFEEAPNSPSQLYHLASTSEVGLGLAHPSFFFCFFGSSPPRASGCPVASRHLSEAASYLQSRSHHAL
jgi:hypothetical protein